MSASSNRSAGLLLFRRRHGEVELFLAHPGGPFWRHRDVGAWTIPKGAPEPDEELLAAAIREFREETGLHPQSPLIELGSIRQKGGKRVFAWAFEGDANPESIVSNTIRAEWPRGSGRWLEYPEVDRCAWFAEGEARMRLIPAQVEFIDRLRQILSPHEG